MRTFGGIMCLSGLLVLTACSTTTVATANTAISGSSANARQETSVASDANGTSTVTPSSIASTPPTPTSAPPTTAPPTTEPSTTAPPTTVAPTTTTVPVNTRVEVPAINPPIEPVGRRNGDATKRAQWRLLQLGFWLREPNGKYDATTSQAVTAFQKYYGLERDGTIGAKTAQYLSNVTIKPHGRTDAGTILEVDKKKQVLFLTDDGVTQWVINISSGSEKPYDYPSKKDPTKREKGDAVTRNGLHKIYRQQADGWWDGDLGKIYRPKYFTGGIAFHGYRNVPPYPASHGCVRLSLPAMDWIWDNKLMPMGTPVWVHDGAPEEYDSVVAVNERLWINAHSKTDA